MRLCFLIAFILFINNGLCQHQSVTVNVKERVNFLKFQLQEQLKAKLKRDKNKTPDEFHIPDNEEPKLINYNYDYVDLSQVPITPINENDERKKDEKYKLRQLRTTTTSTTTTTTTRPSTTKAPSTLKVPISVAVPAPFNPISDKVLQEQKSQKSQKTQKNQKSPKKSKKKKKKKKKPKPKINERSENSISSIVRPTTTMRAVEIFYRRLLEGMKNTPIQWTHCADMLTPFITGVKKELAHPKFMGATHRTVLRLVHLLSLNTTTYAKDEIYSLMYQISNIQVRLFQWEVGALKLVFNAINKGKTHTFRILKRSVKDMFKVWHMDISNTNNLLSQSRLFRPYCINDIGLDGSTKSSKVYKYIPTTPTTTCDEEDEDKRR